MRHGPPNISVIRSSIASHPLAPLCVHLIDRAPRRQEEGCYRLRIARPSIGRSAVPLIGSPETFPYLAIGSSIRQTNLEFRKHTLTALNGMMHSVHGVDILVNPV